jgi:nucleoside 2-deoxyribosyltransferase
MPVAERGDNDPTVRVYLAGAMEHAPDRGKGWRDRLLPLLSDLGHEAFNPNVEEFRVVSEEERARFSEWKASGNERFHRLMDRIITHDLDALSEADYLICYWDHYTHRSGGTPSEITLMRHWGKPVYLVLGVPRSEVSAWVLGCASRIFESFDDLSVFLCEEFVGG